MAIISKISCGLLALMNMMVAINHLKDPIESLKGFGVVGPISPVAAHCCAIIGSSSFPVVGMLLYSIFAPANVRKTLTLCYLSSIPPSIAVQMWYPFNDPAPRFPMDMPYPLLVFMIVLGGASYMLDSDAPKGKKK